MYNETTEQRFISLGLLWSVSVGWHCHTISCNDIAIFYFCFSLAYISLQRRHREKLQAHFSSSRSLRDCSVNASGLMSKSTPRFQYSLHLQNVSLKLPSICTSWHVLIIIINTMFPWAPLLRIYSELQQEIYDMTGCFSSASSILFLIIWHGLVGDWQKSWGVHLLRDMRENTAHHVFLVADSCDNLQVGILHLCWCSDLILLYKNRKFFKMQELDLFYFYVWEVKGEWKN